MTPEPHIDVEALYELLMRPDFADRMRAADLVSFHVGFWPPGEPDPQHEQLWDMILAERPDWRPWYDWARRIADQTWVEYRSDPIGGTLL